MDVDGNGIDDSTITAFPTNSVIGVVSATVDAGGLDTIPLDQVQVSLMDPDSQLVGIDTTDAVGTFEFVGVPEGRYRLNIDAPSGSSFVDTVLDLSVTPSQLTFLEIVGSSVREAGDMNYDNVFDVVDVVLLINYVFRGSDPPYPQAVADANCDGTPNVTDVVTLINHVFRGATQPICP